MILKERLWWTQDKKNIVKDGDPRAAFLLGAPGQTISDAIAKQYSIINGMLQKQGPIPINKMSKPPKNKKGEK